jgi:GH25 family lysozyme M1 (1,4-beta-N-acetylmuramidase)
VRWACRRRWTWSARSCPASRRRDFAIAFLRRLKKNGFGRVAVYANTSMFATIRPDQWDIEGLVIWAARYGPNNGARHEGLRPYNGRADVHQYTSVGRVPGIGPEFVDLNESLTDVTEDDMSRTDQLTYSGPEGKTHTYDAAPWLMWTSHYANMIPGIAATVAAQGQQIAGLVELVKKLAKEEAQP